MSTTTLSLSIYSGTPPVLTNADGAVLFGDKTNSIAVQTFPQGVTVIPPSLGTSWGSPISTGIYEYTLTDPALGLTYLYWVNFTVNSVPYWRYLYATGTPFSNYIGRYTSEASLKLFLGSINVTVLSDANSELNPTGGVDNSAAVAQAIMSAENEIDSRISPPSLGYPYTVPLNFGTNPVDASLTNQANQLAAYWLWTKQYLNAVTKDDVRFRMMRDEVIVWCKDVAYGDTAIIGIQSNSQTISVSPGAVATVNAIGVPILPNGAPAWPGAVWGWGYFNGAWGWGWC